MEASERDAILESWRPIMDAVCDRARDRNQGAEPDELHIAYEAELARLNSALFRPKVRITPEMVNPVPRGSIYLDEAMRRTIARQVLEAAGFEVVE
jgi:hypothetical protein